VLALGFCVEPAFEEFFGGTFVDRGDGHFAHKDSYLKGCDRVEPTGPGRPMGQLGISRGKGAVCQCCRVEFNTETRRHGGVREEGEGEMVEQVFSGRMGGNLV
jgi:hypothetical protein